jgi:hypothetical protein
MGTKPATFLSPATLEPVMAVSATSDCHSGDATNVEANRRRRRLQTLLHDQA